MKNGLPQFQLKRCIACAHCGVYCPANAFCLEPLSPNPVTSESFTKLLKSRRSARRYSDRQISAETIEELLSVISQSPTGMNAQGISVKVINGRENVQALLKPVRKFLKVIRFTGIPALVGKLTGTDEFLKDFQAGDDPVFRSSPLVLFFYSKRNSPTGNTDAIIAATLVMLHAETLNLGTLWNGVALFLSKIIPRWPQSTGRKRKTSKLHAVLCIGYPELRPVSEAPSRTWHED